MENTKSYVVSINENAAAYLYKSASWTTFFAVMGYIGAGLMILISLGMIIGGGVFGRLNPAMAQMPFNIGLLAMIYLPIAAVYIWISTLMLGFASKAKDALRTNNDEMIEQSFKKMKGFLLVLGVFTIIGIALSFIMMIGGIIAGMTGAAAGMV